MIKVNFKFLVLFSQMYTDSMLTFASYKTVREHLDMLSSSVYYYHFAHKGSVSYSSLHGDKVRDYGPSHGDELLYMFPVREQLFKKIPTTSEDEEMIDIMTSLWINFAKSGNPTPEITAKIPVKWKPVKSHSLEFLHIKSSKEIFMDHNLWPDRIQFWKNVQFSDYISNSVPTKLLKDEL